MAWTTPITYVSGAVATAADMNTYVKDDIIYLKGLLDGTGGAVTVTVPDRFQLSNDSLLAIYKSSGQPIFLFDTNDFILYDRTANTWGYYVGGALKFLIDGNGKLTGAGFYASAKTAVTAGATQAFAHGLGAQPRWVWAYHDNGANNGVTTKPVATPGGTFATFTTIDATNVNVNNGTGATTQIQVFAIL